jgi:hypothetical protein
MPQAGVKCLNPAPRFLGIYFPGLNHIFSHISVKSLFRVIKSFNGVYSGVYGLKMGVVIFYYVKPIRPQPFFLRDKIAALGYVKM